jgi:serine protease AprX
VDTGVADVPELAGRVRHVDVTGDGVGDGYGHGTFVAGLVAGSSVGAAPAAEVLDVRVGHDDGSTSLSDVLAGLEVVASHPEVDVVNLSLSSDSPVGADPLTMALDQLWASGRVVVVPAGNDGPGRGTVSSPGTDALLLTVGGLDTAGTPDRADDSVASWSSRGGRGLQKPDLVAAGAHVVSAAAPGSVVWSSNPASRVDDDLFVGSGTSFSAALVSGAVAAVLARRPSLTPDRVKALLARSAYDVAGPRRATGAGALDVDLALVQRAPRATQELPDEAALEWEASSWAASSWAARQWAARQWSARQWSARQWSALAWE